MNTQTNTTKKEKKMYLEIWLGRIFVGVLLYAFLHIAFLQIHGVNVLSDELATAIADQVIIEIRDIQTKNGCFDLRE
jgi:hypothetical protein